MDSRYNTHVVNLFRGNAACRKLLENTHTAVDMVCMLRALDEMYLDFIGAHANHPTEAHVREQHMLLWMQQHCALLDDLYRDK